MKVRAVLALALGASGCDILTSSFATNPYSGDQYPIIVEADSGALVVGMQIEGRTSFQTAVLDVLSPITLVDRGPDAEPQFDEWTYTMFGAAAPGAPLDIPRARFTEKTVATLHPCALDNPICSIGGIDAPRSFDAIIGLDAFSSDSLRLRMASQQIFVFPDIAGDSVRRSNACDAVLPEPFRGGGTLVFGGAEISFPNRRVAIDTCLAPNPDPGVTQRERGVDALMVLSTAIGPSLIGESTYARYRELRPTEPELSTLPESTILLASGPVTGRMTSLPSIALVGNLSSAPRAPCRQVYANHLLESGTCAVGADCPCEDNERFCAAPAIIELAPPTRLPVLVISDSDPSDPAGLQALRTELRPDRPDVDGILGTSALALLELDIDYPNDRLIGRCIDMVNCGARIQIDNEGENRTVVTTCLGTERGPFP